jgi:hypothetical protein
MVYKMLLEYSPHCDHALEARAGLDTLIHIFGQGRKYGSGRAERAFVSDLHRNTTKMLTINVTGDILSYETTRCLAIGSITAFVNGD